jgi:hypothetical protein
MGAAMAGLFRAAPGAELPGWEKSAGVLPPASAVPRPAQEGPGPAPHQPTPRRKERRAQDRRGFAGDPLAARLDLAPSPHLPPEASPAEVPVLSAGSCCLTLPVRDFNRFRSGRTPSRRSRQYGVSKDAKKHCGEYARIGATAGALRMSTSKTAAADRSHRTLQQPAGCHNASVCSAL